MKYRLLPGTGLRVSEICLGTMTFGDQLAEKDAINAVHFAKDQGINFNIKTIGIFGRNWVEIVNQLR